MNKKVYEKISEQLWEEIVEWRRCKWCWEEFAVYEMVKKLEERFENPVNDKCPSCSMRHLMLWRNHRKLYRNKDINWKPVISMIAPESGYKIIKSEDIVNYDVYQKNSYNINDYNDFEKEFNKLLKEIPFLAMYNENTENSEYANFVSKVKNAYLSAVVYIDCENIFYSEFVMESKDIVDSYAVFYSQLVWNSLYVKNSYKVINSSWIDGSNNIYFSTRLVNCEECILCSNLTGKKYCYKNQQLSKEEYMKKKEELLEKLSTRSWYEQLQKEYEEVIRNSTAKWLDMINTEHSIWNIIRDSKDAILAFEWYELENVFNVMWEKLSNCLNSLSWYGSYFCNCSRVWWADWPLVGCFSAIFSSYVFHSINCFGSNNIMASIGIFNWENVILNRKLDKQRYEEEFKRLKNILKEAWKWWEFFKPIWSPIPYNDSWAMEYYPIRDLNLVNIENNELINKLFSEGYLYNEEADKLRNLLNENIGQKVLIDGNWYGKVYIFEPEKFISKAILDLGGNSLIGISWRTKEKEINVPEWINLIKSQQLPENVKELDKPKELEILKSAIVCKVSWRPFRIINLELDFYKKLNLPLPDKHPDIRHKERLKLRPKRELYLRRCDKCWKEMLSVYSEDVEFKVYCQECYDKEFV